MITMKAAAGVVRKRSTTLATASEGAAGVGAELEVETQSMAVSDEIVAAMMIGREVDRERVVRHMFEPDGGT